MTDREFSCFFSCAGTKEENEPLAEAMDVKSYPSIHLFNYQNFVKAYLGKPKKKNLRNFLLSSVYSDNEVVANSAEKKKEEGEEKREKREKVEVKKKDEMKKEKKEKDVVDSKSELTEEEFKKMKMKKMEVKGKEEEEKRETREATTAAAVEAAVEAAPAPTAPTAPTAAPAPTAPTAPTAPPAEKLPSVLSFNSLVLQQILRRDITIPFSKTCQIIFLYSGNHPLEKELTKMFQQVAEIIQSVSATQVPKCVFLAADTDEDARVLKFFNVTKKTTSVHVVLFGHGMMAETEMHWKINVLTEDQEEEDQEEEDKEEEDQEEDPQMLSVNKVVSIVSDIIMGTTLRTPDYQKMPPPLWSALKTKVHSSTDWVTGASFKKRVVETNGVRNFFAYFGRYYFWIFDL